MDITIPPFRPLRLLRGGHAQTLASFWLPCRHKEPYTARQHIVTLPDGDQIVLHEDCPKDWCYGGPTALLVHGLCGSHRSVYMVRAAAKLKQRGVRAFRMDHRGCGTAGGLARRPYHGGSSNDVAVALRTIGGLCPDSPTSLVGYSMGGNIALKLAGEAPHTLPGNLRSILAFSPSIDLAAAAAQMEHRCNRFYDRYFVKFLKQIVASLHQGYRQRGLEPIQVPRFRSLYEFNEFFFTRVWRFGSLERFYALCSSAQFLPHINLPTLVVTAADDPLVPIHCFHQARFSPTTRLVITKRGGHLGFIGKAEPADPDCRWMDWRVVDWVTRSLTGLSGGPACRRALAMNSPTCYSAVFNRNQAFGEPIHGGAMEASADDGTGFAAGMCHPAAAVFAANTAQNLAQ